MENFRTMRELLHLVKGYKAFYISFFIVVLTGGLQVCTPFLVLKIFDEAILNFDLRKLFLYVLFIAVLVIAQAAFEILNQRIISNLNRKLVLNLRERCFNYTDKLSGDFMSNYNSGQLFTILYRDVEEIPTILTTAFFRAISNMIIIIGLAVFLLTLQSDLLFILILFQIILYSVHKIYSKRISVSTGEIRMAIGMLNSSAQEWSSNLFAFVEGGLKEYFKKKHNKLEANFADKYIYGACVVSQNQSILSCINALTTVSILGYGGYKVIMGDLSYGGLMSFNLYAQRLASPILQIAQFSNRLTATSIAWKRINKLLSTQISVHNGNLTPRLKGEINFDKVNFGYDKKQTVLNEVSMELRRGKIHALVGPSGVGKTTLMHLLFRAWDVQQGKITIDDLDIKDIDIDCLRGQISIVSQSIFLLNDSIRNNIVLDRMVSEEVLDNVMKQADIYNFINSLPKKLDTEIGENGIKLSGGEKQRISIARALLRQNPILIFDEATSMLDNETEDKIINILLRSFSNSTIILIAHRLSTVKEADSIYVLKEGTVVEHGKHEQLLEKKGFYYYLYNI